MKANNNKNENVRNKIRKEKQKKIEQKKQMQENGELIILRIRIKKEQ